MKPCNPNAKLETKCLHAGYTPKNGGPGTVPIVQSTTYRFDSTEKVAELFAHGTHVLPFRQPHL